MRAQRAEGRLASVRRRHEPQLSRLRGSETAKAVGLAGAMITNNVIALVSTVVFARLLSDYGALAALISYFLILSVAGQALQVATAREGVLGHLGVGAGLIATLKSWAKSMAVFTVVLSMISILLRDPIAQLLNVPNDQWAAALGLPAGCLWLALSILRGALQGVGDFKSVGLSLIGEQGSRLIAGAALAAGLGVFGAFLATPISFIAMCAYCTVQLRRYATAFPAAAAGAPPAQRSLGLLVHVKRAWAPIAGLIVIAVLQNIDIIAAKHRFAGIKDLASSYASTAVAAKVLVWVAVGASFYLVPEVSRRRAGREDPRPVLARALGIILVCAVPVLLIYAFAAHPLMAAVFKPQFLKATDALLVLGVAFTVLAGTSLAIQYMLALKRTWFLIGVGLVALAEPILLLQAPKRPAGFAAMVLGIQVVGAIVAFTLALWPQTPSPLAQAEPPPGVPERELVGASELS
jgi:O-antigen/teichoic acid export membrane protein